MTIDTDHNIDRDAYPPAPATVTLTIGDIAHELAPAQTRDVISALTCELDAIEAWQINVHLANNPAPAALMERSEWIEAGRQRQRDAIAAQEAAEQAERTRQAQEASNRRAAIYAARQAESDAQWQARAQRIRAERAAQEADQ